MEIICRCLKMLIVVYLFGGVYLEDHENINFTRGNHMHKQLPFWYHGGGSLTSTLAFCEWRYLHSLVSTNHCLDCHQDRSHDEGSCACALHMASTIPFWYHGGGVTNKALWPCVCEEVSINTCIHYPAELMPWSINIKWRPSKPAFSAKLYCITTYILIISQERGGTACRLQ